MMKKLTGFLKKTKGFTKHVKSYYFHKRIIQQIKYLPTYADEINQNTSSGVKMQETVDLTYNRGNFNGKNLTYFLIFAQNIDCGYTLEPPRRGGSNEYPQPMFWSKIKKNRYTPAYMYPSFTIYFTRTCFHDAKQFRLYKLMVTKTY